MDAVSLLLTSSWRSVVCIPILYCYSKFYAYIFIHFRTDEQEIGGKRSVKKKSKKTATAVCGCFVYTDEILFLQYTVIRCYIPGCENCRTRLKILHHQITATTF